MRDLSLHILDLLENSVRAEASVVQVQLAHDPAADTLRILLEDDGPGLDVPVVQALDPFYTTKRGKRTGLGLPLFQASVEQAGGELRLGRSTLGGLAVDATLRSGHIDRLPLGDVGATMSVIHCTHPELDLRCELSSERGRCAVRVTELAAELPEQDRSCFVVAAQLANRIRNELRNLGFPD